MGDLHSFAVTATFFTGNFWVNTISFLRNTGEHKFFWVTHDTQKNFWMKTPTEYLVLTLPPGGGRDILVYQKFWGSILDFSIDSKILRIIPIITARGLKVSAPLIFFATLVDA